MNIESILRIYHISIDMNEIKSSYKFTLFLNFKILCKDFNKYDFANLFLGNNPWKL